MPDDETLRFYAENAAAYAERASKRPSPQLAAFLDLLSPGACILELGTGGGQDARFMLDRGFDVRPTDGSAELAVEAEKLLGRPVRVMLFDALNDEAAFDGVYANASLLHAKRAALTGILSRIHRALAPGGRFWATYKAGDAEGRDSFGRYYNYLDAESLRRHYSNAATWQSLEITAWDGSGYDKLPTKWLGVIALK